MEACERLMSSKWFSKQVEREAAKDVLPPSEWIGQLIGFVCGVILLAFFAIHETRPTGFFTEDFGSADAALLYAFIVLGMISPLVRFVFGRKNVGRPFDALGIAYVFVVGLYFLVKFPFDFSHFADPLPRALEPLLDWIPGDLARWLLGIGVVFSPFISAYNLLLYMGIKKRLSEKKEADSKSNAKQSAV